MGRAAERAEQDALRVDMLGAGMTYADIADEFIRRYRLRRRAAFRHAHGWTLVRAADHINGQAARLGIDPDGRAAMTSSYLCELEHYPYPAPRRLTPHMLALLATVYGTDVHSLLDAHDRQRLRPADRLVIDSMVCLGQPAACLCGRHRERPAPGVSASPLGTLASTASAAR